ncbi:MAG: Translation initiation factor IF-3 [Parcubacteria group bacterium GW2011_GWC2_39_14]|nr:MAG: Translation initiation factor IF-3 [Parcubacteria group bacterium GW2011_GWC2_39_14]KKR54958.1 MAG: Translation initiation factor IF-3 [Parcubacteria group bacterium GW2011_GWA2_40_23]
MRKSYKFKKREKITKKFYFNNKILAPEVMVIDEFNKQLGVFETKEAVQMAQDRGFDLVEVSPVGNPPVCRIMNYGSFKYQKEKQEKQQKKQTKTLDIKSVRISMKISDHDKETKVNMAERFLEKGHKVKVELILRGREFEHIDRAKEIMNDFKAKLKTRVQVEQDTSKQGNKMFLILVPEK